MIYNGINFGCFMCVEDEGNRAGMGLKLGQWPKNEKNRQLFYLSILYFSINWHLLFFLCPLFIRKN